MSLSSTLLLAIACTSSAFGAAVASASDVDETALIMNLAKTEAAFWAQFNRVNTNPAYETHCTVRKRFESHLTRQVCTPQFFDGATEAEAKWDLGALSGDGTALQFPFVDAQEVVSANMKTYRSRVQVLARQDTKLSQLARKYLALRQQFDAAHRSR